MAEQTTGRSNRGAACLVPVSKIWGSGAPALHVLAYDTQIKTVPDDMDDVRRSAISGSSTFVETLALDSQAVSVTPAMSLPCWTGLLVGGELPV